MLLYNEPVDPAEDSLGLPEEETGATEEDNFNAIRTILEEPVKGQTDSEVGDILEGMTLQIGNLDTGIEYNKDVAAFMVGTGDLMFDSARGIAQILKNYGIADLIDEESQNANEIIMDTLYDDPDYGVSAMGGAVVGAVVEPLGFLLPVSKATTATKAVLGASVLGGLYGTSMYVTPDESRLKNTAFSAALGGVGGYLAHRFFRNAVGSKVDDLVEDERQRVKVLSPDPKTGKPHYSTPSKAVPSKPHYSTPAKAVDSAEDIAIKTSDDIEVRASIEGAKHSKIQKAKNLIDNVIRPVYDYAKQYSTKLAAGLRRVDSEQHLKAKRWTNHTLGFNKFFSGLDKKTQVEVWQSLNRYGLKPATLAKIRRLGGDEAVTQVKEVRAVLKEIMEEYKSVGYKITPRDYYFPTTVKDLDVLVRSHQKQVDKVIAKQVQANGGTPLTANQEAHIMERMMTFNVRHSNTAGALKNRVVREVDDDMLQAAYHDPVTALHYYISSAAEDIAKRRFFKRMGHKANAKKGLDVTGADLDDSINDIVAALRDKKMGIQEEKQLVDILRGRFSADVHKTHALTQAVKNVSYTSTLGNFWSALTQLGDLVFAVHKYGIKNAVKGLLGPKISSKEALGIEKAMVEFNSARSVTSKVADWAFKYGGFDALDALGKNTSINASVRFNRQLAIKNPAKFKKKWQATFGRETDEVLEEFQHLKLEKNAKMSDNAALLLWNELADTQPIGLSEMPLKYLQNPNGRILYAYKTFTLKQLNYMRNTINKEGNPVKRAADLTYFSTLFVLANGGVDGLKAFMSGDDIDIEDKLLDNFISLGGTSKYAVDKSKGIGSIIAQGFLPVPLTQGVKAADALSSGDFSAGDVVNQLPIVGKMNREWDIVR